MYFVEQKYYASGDIKAKILSEKGAAKRGYDGKRFVRMPGYDLYVDLIPNLQTAKSLLREIGQEKA